MVETELPPESMRAMEYPAELSTTIKRMLAYSQCCCETAEVLSGLLLSANLTQALREKVSRLRDGQKVMGREMLGAVTAATEEGKAREAGMLSLPLEGDATNETPRAFR